ncbi:hypothetical protein K7432_003602 [Basidiobolus ranarum]|uniref:SANTA domain-containing protein n=1 Tax=Basidiobolus ranarum TaxID=34480 RepID=A0ABR2W655_9FUNG
MSCQDRVPSEAIFRIPDFSVLRSPTPRSRSVSRCMTPAATSAIHESNSMTPSKSNRFSQISRIGTPQAQPLMNTGGFDSAIFRREATLPPRIREASIPLTDMFGNNNNSSFERLSVASPIPQLIRRTYSHIESTELKAKEVQTNNNSLEKVAETVSSKSSSTLPPVTSKSTQPKRASKTSLLKSKVSPEVLPEGSLSKNNNVDSQSIKNSTLQNETSKEIPIMNANMESAPESSYPSTEATTNISKTRVSKRRVNVAAKSVSKSMNKTATLKPKVKTKLPTRSSDKSTDQRLPDPPLEPVSESGKSDLSEPIVLKEWRLRKARTGNKLANFEFWIIIEGLRVMGDQNERVWHSSLIAERVDRTTLKTFSGSVYQISGPISPQGMSVAGFSPEFTNLFKDGFPEEWKSWICVEFDGELSSQKKNSDKKSKNQLNDSNEENTREKDAPTTLTEIANISPQQPDDHLEFDNEGFDFPYNDDHLNVDNDKDPQINKQTPSKAPRRSGRKPKPRLNLVVRKRTRKAVKKEQPEPESNEIHGLDAVLDKQIIVPQEKKSVSIKTSSKKLKMKLDKPPVKETLSPTNAENNSPEPHIPTPSHQTSVSLSDELPTESMKATTVHPETPKKRLNVAAKSTQRRKSQDSKHDQTKSEKTGNKEKEIDSEPGITRSGRSIRKPREFWIIDDNDHSNTPSKRLRRTSEKPAKLEQKPTHPRKRRG